MSHPATAPTGRAVAACLGALVAAVVLAAAPAARAQPAHNPAPAPASRTVVLAPLSTLGAEDTSAAAQAIQLDLERALGAIEGTAVIGAKAALDRVKKAKRPELRVCEGDRACLAELGKLVGADLVVAGEAGGLGEIRVVYLQLVDVASGKELRSTTLAVGDEAEGGAAGAAYRLLAPDQYVGTLTLAIDTAGATIYLDGRRVGKAPHPTITTTVGTHALRVTHPEYRDFVRFVDVGFRADTRVDVALQQFPIVQTELAGDGAPLGPGVVYVDRPAPWYRSWWAVAAFAGVVAIASTATFAILADGTDADAVRPVKP